MTTATRDLSLSAARVNAAEHRLNRIRAQFYNRIRKAHASGMTLRAIAAETGLSYGRIHQIVQR